ncbi:hypothetical protein [Evtepia sp.]|uniref:hypothetical protein n=1 Tax=Evtepia sp. TaxID=2773933 RepID=UPI003F15A9FB
MKKRLLAMMMAFVMAMSLLPMSAFAATTDLAEGQVKATKTLTDNSKWNLYY